MTETPTAPPRPGVTVVLSRCAEVGPACAAALAAEPPRPGEPGERTTILLGLGDPPSGVVGVELAADSAAAVASALAEIAAVHGPVETLVTVPGHGMARSVVRTAGDDPFEEHLDRELGVVHRALRSVAPGMVAAKGGRIVFVSSTTALTGAPWETAHGAAMAGLVGLARSAARELASSAVTVNVVLAGAIDTEHLRAVRDRDRRGADAVAGAVAATPIRRLGTPADVAAAVAFLVSPDASYLTGVVLPVDGGLAMGIG
ncbi:MAG: 3-oxoacyl-(acyl-carrier-protein) reductase [Acidimicrobiales bacterium]|nr:3-oxoacyl-(acyl-carrier-protein) reductase [Acidimicrobiales bacterium]